MERLAITFDMGEESFSYVTRKKDISFWGVFRKPLFLRYSVNRNDKKMSLEKRFIIRNRPYFVFLFSYDNVFVSSTTTRNVCVECRLESKNDENYYIEILPNNIIARIGEEVVYGELPKSSEIERDEDKSCKMMADERLVQAATLVYQKAISQNQMLYQRIVDKNTFEDQLIDVISSHLEEETEDEILETVSDYFIDFSKSEKYYARILKDLTFEKFFLDYYSKSVPEDYLEIAREIAKVDYDEVMSEVSPTVLGSRHIKIIISDIVNLRISDLMRRVNEKKRKDFEEFICTKYTREAIKSQYQNELNILKSNENVDMFFDYEYGEILQSSITENDFIENLENGIKNYVKSVVLYEDIISTYGNKVIIQLTEEKKSLFDNPDSVIPDNLSLEKKIYDFLEPFRLEFMFRKGSKTYKASVQYFYQLETFADTVIAKALDCDIFNKSGNVYEFSSFEKMAVFEKEIKNLINPDNWRLNKKITSNQERFFAIDNKENK